MTKIHWPRLIVSIIIVQLAVWGIYYWYSQTQNENNKIRPTSIGQVTKFVDKNWLTYISNKGFRLSYPSDWEVTENGGDNYDPSVVSLRSPVTTEKLNNQQIPYTQDVNIYYYSSIPDEPENKGNNLGATTLDQLIVKNPVIAKIGSIKIGGLSGIDVVWGGQEAYYTILIVKNTQLYKIQFSKSEKSSLTDTEKEILNSIVFTN